MNSITPTLDRINLIVNQLMPACGVLDKRQDLQELGLTSMQMVNLMLTIESEFDLTIPSTKLVPANFRSIAKIEALLDELTH